jgi:hypothetical protein
VVFLSLQSYTECPKNGALTVHCAVEEFTFLYLDYLVVIVFFVVLDLLFLFSFFFIDTFIRFNRNVNENLHC